jgi:hypothetical protein
LYFGLTDNQSPNNAHQQSFMGAERAAKTGLFWVLSSKISSAASAFHCLAVLDIMR